MAFLVAIEAEPAAFRHTQDEVAAATIDWLRQANAAVDPRSVERLFSRAGVEARAAGTPLADVFRNATFAERNAVYHRAMVESGVSIARATLQAAGLQNVDLIVSSSCTGFMIPAVDAFIANELSLGPKVARLPITESGCAGGAVALARARDFVQAHPKAAALVAAIEFSSMTFQSEDFSATNLVAIALFADGAGGAVLVGREHKAAARAFAELVGAESRFLPNSLGAMGYEVVESGLKLVLDKRLPDSLRGRLRPMVDEFLEAHNAGFADLSAFAIHPGGRRVLDVVEEELGLSAPQMEPSRSVLREHGNMSSATILFVLHRVLPNLLPAQIALGIGFGPGFTIELSLWRGFGPVPEPPLPLR